MLAVSRVHLDKRPLVSVGILNYHYENYSAFALFSTETTGRAISSYKIAHLQLPEMAHSR